MASINSKSIEFELVDDDRKLKSDIKNVVEFLTLYVAEQLKATTGIRHAKIRVSASLGTKGTVTGSVYQSLLLQKLSETGAVLRVMDVENHASFDFVENKFLWKGKEIYVTDREKYAIYTYLTRAEFFDKGERGATAQALFRLRARFGKEFPGERSDKVKSLD